MELTLFINMYSDLIELTYINYCAGMPVWVSSPKVSPLFSSSQSQQLIRLNIIYPDMTDVKIP